MSLLNWLFGNKKDASNKDYSKMNQQHNSKTKVPCKKCGKQIYSNMAKQSKGLCLSCTTTSVFDASNYPPRKPKPSTKPNRKDSENSLLSNSKDSKETNQQHNQQSLLCSNCEQQQPKERTDKISKQSSHLESLINQLKYNEDVFARRNAAYSLAKHIDMRAVIALIGALKGNKPGVIKTTGTGKNITAVHLSDPNDALNSDIDNCIQNAINTGASTVEVYLYGNGSVKSAAASSLIEISSQLNTEEAITPLLDALTDEDEFIKRTIFVALCRLSIQTHSCKAIKGLVRVQPVIDSNMLGHPIIDSHQAKDELILLLEKLKGTDNPEPFAICIESREPSVQMFGVTTLLEMQKTKMVLTAIRHAKINEATFDTVFLSIEKNDAEFALISLIELIKNGSPLIKVFAARKLLHFSDERAVAALSEWQIFLKESFSGKPVACHKCGRKTKKESQENTYWCSWCGKSITLEDIYASQE